MARYLLDVLDDRIIITGSRVMVFSYSMDEVRVFVWDWKTGDLVILLRFEES